MLDLLLPGTSKKKRDGKGKGGKPIITPMGAFSMNPKDSGGGTLMGTAIQVGIPIHRKRSAADEEKEGEEFERTLSPEEKAKFHETREKIRTI